MADQADFTLKIGHVSATTQPVYTCVEVMKSYVERYSRGRIAVEHYPAGHPKRQETYRLGERL